jgi:hypothetical protein
MARARAPQNSEVRVLRSMSDPCRLRPPLRLRRTERLRLRRMEWLRLRRMEWLRLRRAEQRVPGWVDDATS